MREKLCTTFRLISIDVWNLLRDSLYYGYYETSSSIRRGLGFSEETISDLMLLKLSKRQPYDIITIKFAKSLEALEGADWEWWILSNNCITGLRLQAKKLHVRGNIYEYTYLDYRRRTDNIEQIDILINNSQSTGMAPLYMFYNWWDVDYPFRNYLNPNIPNCCKISSSKQLGITIASAWEIKEKVHRNQKSLSDILRISYPISCLVCCKYSNLAESVYKFLNEWVLKDKIEIKIHKKLPENVYSRLKGKFDEKSPIYTLLILDLKNQNKEINKILNIINNTIYKEEFYI